MPEVDTSVVAIERIVCYERLGSVFKHYGRAAA